MFTIRSHNLFVSVQLHFLKFHWHCMFSFSGCSLRLSQHFKYGDTQNEDWICFCSDLPVPPQFCQPSPTSKRHHLRPLLQKHGLCNEPLQNNIRLPWQEHLFLPSEHFKHICCSLNGLRWCHISRNTQRTQPGAAGASRSARAHPQTLSAP